MTMFDCSKWVRYSAKWLGTPVAPPDLKAVLAAIDS